MSKTNLQKKEEIDVILLKYKNKIFELKNKCDKSVSNFIEILRQKQIEEIKKSLK